MTQKLRERETNCHTGSSSSRAGLWKDWYELILRVINGGVSKLVLHELRFSFLSVSMSLCLTRSACHLRQLYYPNSSYNQSWAFRVKALLQLKATGLLVIMVKHSNSSHSCCCCFLMCSECPNLLLSVYMAKMGFGDVFFLLVSSQKPLKKQNKLKLCVHWNASKSI